MRFLLKITATSVEVKKIISVNEPKNSGMKEKLPSLGVNVYELPIESQTYVLVRAYCVLMSNVLFKV